MKDIKNDFLPMFRVEQWKDGLLVRLQVSYFESTSENQFGVNHWTVHYSYLADEFSFGV